jgi:glycosyltransferase involved in cell wall biosynthesis
MDISVVIPVRDEENSVRALLEGLLKQTLAPKEIIITDGGSADATVQIIEEFINAGAPVKLFRERNSMPGRARNIGAKHAAGEWIAFTDAGTIPAPNWLASRIERVTSDSTVDVVYGGFAPVIDSFFKECAVIAYLPPPTQIEGRLTPARSIASALMRRKVWDAVGGFPEHLRSAEDLLFMQRIDEHGFREVRAPDALVYWSIQPNLWRTFKRFAVYARNNIRAGLWRKWQAAIFQRYAILALIAVAAIFLGAKWLIVPLACWLFFLFARATNALRKHRVASPASTGRNILRVLVIVPITAALDLAVFVGSINWLLFDKLRVTGARPNDVPR